MIFLISTSGIEPSPFGVQSESFTSLLRCTQLFLPDRRNRLYPYFYAGNTIKIPIYKNFYVIWRKIFQIFFSNLLPISIYQLPSIMSLLQYGFKRQKINKDSIRFEFLILITTIYICSLIGLFMKFCTRITILLAR